MPEVRSRQPLRWLAALSVPMMAASVGFSGCAQGSTNSLEAVGSEATADSEQCLMVDNDDYPYAGAPFCTNSSCVDPWGFYERQCTSFVAFRMNQLGIPFSNRMQGGHFGDAGHWAANASALGYTVDNTPSPNAIAAWDSGHVAVVKCATADGNIVVEEYNEHWNGTYDTRTIPASSPSHYIHMQ